VIPQTPMVAGRVRLPAGVIERRWAVGGSTVTCHPRSCSRRGAGASPYGEELARPDAEQAHRLSRAAARGGAVLVARDRRSLDRAVTGIGLRPGELLRLVRLQQLRIVRRCQTARYILQRPTQVACPAPAVKARRRCEHWRSLSPLGLTVEQRSEKEGRHDV